MRFNDLLDTVLASETTEGAGAITHWRQCVDLLAQYDRAPDPALGKDQRDRLLARLTGLRDAVTEPQRMASVVELGGRLRSPSLVAFFSGDRPAVCVAAMLRANLPDAIWPDVMPHLTPIARGALRNRRDMGELAKRALETYGKYDLLLENEGGVAVPMSGERAESSTPLMNSHHAAQADETAQHVTQIRELVDRIARYTQEGRTVQDRPTAPPVPQVKIGVPVRHFPFETDMEGMLIWAGEVQQSALVGLSIAEPALPGFTGPDGGIAGAFSRRGIIQNGRFWISDGPFSGEWRISATPFFNQATGRFQGYRGQARRPFLVEVAAPVEALTPSVPEGDDLRQVVHELRTPLNAILGFAEIIESQMFGPASPKYRDMATHIVSDARRLLDSIDDLDLLGQRKSGDSSEQRAPAGASADLRPLVDQIVVELAEANHPRLNIAGGEDAPPTSLSIRDLHRIVRHFVRTLVNVAEHEEELSGSIWSAPDGRGARLLFGVSRPKRIMGMSPQQLLELSDEDETPESAGLLGLGFALRLIGNLARDSKSELLMTDAQIMLSFPVTGMGAEA